MSLLTSVVVLLAACGGKPECDTQSSPDPSDTAADACGGGGPTEPTESDSDTEDTEDSVPDGTSAVSEMTVSNGETVTFTGSMIIGEHDDVAFGFTATGSSATNALTIGVSSGSGLGTYVLTDGEGDSPAVYTDFTWGVENGGFVSTGGSVTVTSWEPTTWFGAPASAASGTFTIQLTNSPDPVDPAPLPLTIDATGTFTGVPLITASP